MKKIDNLIVRIIDNKSLSLLLFILTLTSVCIYLLNATDHILGHDYFFHERRFGALAEAIQSGTFPAYMDPYAIDGYGYLSNAFYSDIILLPFVPFVKYFGLPFTLRIVFSIFTLLCGLITYWSINRIFKNRFVAATSALLYAFCNYRLLGIFWRSALGEVISFTFIPIVFLGLFYIIKDDYKKKWYIIAIGFTLMLYTHILSSFIMGIIVIVFLITYNKTLRNEPQRLVYLFLAGFVTILCSLYSIAPMLEQMTSQKFHYQVQTWAWTVPAVNTLGLYKLIWGLTSAFSLSGEPFIPRLGLISTLGIALRLFITQKNKTIKDVDNLWKIGLILLLCIGYSSIWEIFPFNKMTTIQFPWRLFEFVSFLFIVAGSYYLSISIHSRIIKTILYVFFIGFTFFIINSERFGSITMQSMEKKYVSSLNSKAKHRTQLNVGGGFEFISDKIPTIRYYEERGDSIGKLYTETEISNFKREKGITSFDVELNQPDSIELPLNYYKGYIATLNKENIDVKLSNFGLIKLPITKSGHVEIHYQGTAIHYYSFYLSILFIMITISYITYSQINRKKNEVSR